MPLSKGLVNASVSETHIILRYEEKEHFLKAKEIIETKIAEKQLPLLVNMPEFDEGVYKFIEVHVDEETLISSFADVLECIGVEYYK